MPTNINEVSIEMPFKMQKQLEMLVHVKGVLPYRVCARKNPKSFHLDFQQMKNK
jgi:hypothetical protein